MRLIDADAFKKYISEGYYDTVGMFKTDEYRMFAKQITESILSDIDEQPAIQPEKTQFSKEGTTKYTTSDMISRQAAIDALQKCRKHCIDPFDSYHIDIQDAENQLSKVPTIQPEPKEGHWITHEFPDDGEQYECSECGVLWEFNDGTPEDNEAYFCPKCGAKMKGDTDGKVN